MNLLLDTHVLLWWFSANPTLSKKAARTIAHTLALANLPDHHQYPFDRMLVAQASIEKLTLITRDKRLRKYNVPIIEA